MDMRPRTLGIREVRMAYEELVETLIWGVIPYISTLSLYGWPLYQPPSPQNPKNNPLASIVMYLSLLCPSLCVLVHIQEEGIWCKVVDQGRAYGS